MISVVWNNKIVTSEFVRGESSVYDLVNVWSVMMLVPFAPCVRFLSLTSDLLPLPPTPPIRAVCILRQAQTKEELDVAKKSHSESTETLRREERELNETKAAVSELKMEANALRAKALHGCNMRGTDAKLPEALQQLFDNLPDTIEDIDAQIFDLRAKADCIAAVDPAKIEEFERRRRRIADLQVCREGGV